MQSSSRKVIEHIPSGFSVSTIPSCKDIENTHDLYTHEVKI